jgi:integration host factor subunit alpha
MSDTLTKAILSERIHERVGVTRKEAGDLVDSVLGLMQEALLEGEKIKISNFGNFVVRDKSARRGRNPQTGEPLIITRRRVMTFKPSQRLRDAMNNR